MPKFRNGRSSLCTLVSRDTVVAHKIKDVCVGFYTFCAIGTFFDKVILQMVGQASHYASTILGIYTCTLIR